MTRSGVRTGLTIAAAAVVAVLPAAALWLTRRTSLRWLAIALVATYLLPWAVAWISASGGRREILARFTLSTAAIATVWLILELAGARLVNYPALTRAPISDWWYGPPYNTADEELLYLHRPYLRLAGSQPGDIAAGLCLRSSVYRYDVRYDRHGFRNETDLDRSAIAVVGDSFVEAPTIPASMTMTSVLARLTGRTIANLGLSAYGPQQELRVVARYAIPLRPDVIVWAFYEGNDFKDMARYDERRAQVRSGMRRRFRLEASLAWNVLLTLQRTVRDGCVPPITPLPSGVRGGAQPLQMHLVRPPSPTDAEIEMLATIIIEADVLARRIESRLIVVFIPTSFRVYHDMVDCRHCDGMIDDVSGRIERRLRAAAHLEYLDLTGPLREAARRGQLVYRPDDTHWTEAGHEVAAEALSRLLGAGAARRGADSLRLQLGVPYSRNVRSNTS